MSVPRVYTRSTRNQDPDNAGVAALGSPVECGGAGTEVLRVDFGFEVEETEECCFVALARGAVEREPTELVMAVCGGFWFFFEKDAGDAGPLRGDCVVEEELAAEVFGECAVAGEEADDVLAAGFGGPEDGAVAGAVGRVEVFRATVEEEACCFFVAAFCGPVERGGVVGDSDLGEGGAAGEELEDEGVAAVVGGPVEYGVEDCVGFMGAEVVEEGCEEVGESTVGADEREEVFGTEVLGGEKEQLGGEVEERHCGGWRGKG